MRRHLSNERARERELLVVLARAEEAAATRLQAAYRGLRGRRQARLEHLRSMDEEQRLSEAERYRRAQQTDQLLKHSHLNHFEVILK